MTRTRSERAPQTLYSADLPPVLAQEPVASTVRPAPVRSVTSSAPLPGTVTRRRRSPSRSDATCVVQVRLPRRNLPRIVFVVGPAQGWRTSSRIAARDSGVGAKAWVDDRPLVTDRSAVRLDEHAI